MIKLNFVCMCLLLSALTGCASSGSHAGRFPTFIVDRTVEAPEKAYFHGVGTNVARMGGLVPALIGRGDLDEATVLTEYLAHHNIDVRSILHERFIEEVQLSSLAAKLHSPAENVMELRIEGYGLGKKEGFANDMRPSIRAEARLVDAKGNVLWKSTENVGGVSWNLPYNKLDGWMSNAAALRDAYGAAATLLAKQMLREFLPPEAQAPRRPPPNRTSSKPHGES
jgi:hypothetical protein